MVGCDFDPTKRVQDLSRSEKTFVAIARALAVEADVLVLDEPTASLPANEVERMFNVLGDLRGRGGGMIYVSHRLDDTFSASPTGWRCFEMANWWVCRPLRKQHLLNS